MKYTAAATAVLIGLLTYAAADVPTTPQINVTGTAVTEVKPDQLVWTVEVKNTGPDISKVADRHSGIVTTLLTVLKQYEIEDHTVQTAHVELGNNRVYRKNDWVEEGYFASTSVTFKLASMAKYKDLWIRLANLGNVTVKNVGFEYAKRIEVTKETRTKALLAAKDKAIAMAKALDATIGEVVSISEDTFAMTSYSTANSLNSGNLRIEPGDAGDSAANGVAPGTIPVRARVMVSFKLVNGAK